MAMGFQGITGTFSRLEAMPQIDDDLFLTLACREAKENPAREVLRGPPPNHLGLLQGKNTPKLQRRQLKRHAGNCSRSLGRPSSVA